jgi:DNA-binding transcriptional ArsR family regulator
VMDVASIAAVAQALGDPTRLAVLDLVDDRASVGEIAAMLRVTSSTTTYHLAILERAMLVTVARRGRRSVPRQRPEGLRALVEALGWHKRTSDVAINPRHPRRAPKRSGDPV